MCVISSLRKDVAISNSDNKRKVLVYSLMSSKVGQRDACLDFITIIFSRCYDSTLEAVTK